MKAWNVCYPNGTKIDTVYYDYDDAEEVKKSLINNGDMLCIGNGKYRHYPDNIVVKLDKKSILNQ